jgi:excisionase family DNA binding protein
MSESDYIMTVPEVAADLRVSRAHVYKVIRGEVPGVSALPAIVIGRRRLVRRSSLELWKAHNEQRRGDGMIAPAHSIDAVGA